MSAERKQLLAMPKVDIHCHLDGSLRVPTILELARRQKHKLPADTVEGLRPFVTVSPACRTLKEFIDVFDVYMPLLRDAESVERVAYELIEDCAAENIVHVEVRDAPVLHAYSKFTAADYIEAALRGLRRGKKDFGVTSSFIVGLFRAHSPKENRTAFDAMKALFKPTSLGEPSVVGMDLCGDEAQFPTLDFADFYEQAKRLGVHTTCHAGETVGTENLKAALALKVERIGHGTHLFEDQKLLGEVVSRKVPIEVGITSNIRTKSAPDLKSHPLRRFYAAGVPVSLNTDDRGVIGIDLTHEYETALRMGFSMDELAGLAFGAVDHLFLPEADKRALKTRFVSAAAGGRRA